MRKHVAGWLVLGLVCANALPAAARQPNVVLIVSDDQAYNDLGVTNPDLDTPGLDRLANEGARLTSFYVTWCACTPSRSGFLTGRYPQRNGLYDMIRNNEVNYGHRFTKAEFPFTPEMTLGMDTREITLAQPLQQAGYHCGAFGKWDGGAPRRFLPLQRGFDEFLGIANTGVDYWTHQRYGIESMYRDNRRVEMDGYATDLFGYEAVEFIHRNKDKPFFLYVPFNAPHGASNLERESQQAPEAALHRYKDRDPTNNRTIHMAMITRMDDWIARMLEALDEHQLADDTLVIFFSDNGGTGVGDNRPLRGSKSTMWEGGVRVCCLMRFPGRIPADTVCDEFLTSLEVFPTVLAAANVPLPEGVHYDGFNLLPVLAGEQPSPRTEMFWQRRDDKAARVGNYKWVESAKGNGVFDLSQDIGEQHDLTAERPELRAMLKQRFLAWQAEMEAAEPRGPFRNY